MPLRWSPPVELSRSEELVIKRCTKRKLFIFLRRHRHEIFDDEMQAALASAYDERRRGEEPVPPGQLAMAALLRSTFNVPDADVPELVVMERRWQMVLDCAGVDEPPFTQATVKMVDMVSTILDVSKLEAGRLVPKLAPHDVGAIASDVAHALGAFSRDRTLTVEPPSAPVVTQLDRELVARVMQNLVGNALKFTPTGGAIRLRVEAEDDAVRVEISDTGPGIPADHPERIFEKFGAVEARAAGRRYSSTGLGLNFSKLALAPLQVRVAGAARRRCEACVRMAARETGRGPT